MEGPPSSLVKELECPALLKELECPVCLLIPRGGPVFQCVLGHLVCRDCQPRLTKCPVCQANFNKPSVTRNFIAETLLLSIQRGCRYEVLGCSYRSKDSRSLVDHESDCSHKPPIPQPSPANHLSDTMELLHVILPIILLVLRILGFIMFLLLTFNTQLVTGPEHISHAPIFSILSDLDVPDLVKEAYSGLQSLLAGQRHVAVKLRATFLAPLSQLVKDLSHSLAEWTVAGLHTVSLCIRDFLSKPVRRRCNYRVEGMVQHLFPDAWLPSSLSHLVWTAPSSSAANMTMVWWPANNTYTDGREVRRFVAEEEDCKAPVVRSLCRWKLDLTGTSLSVASVILESGVEMVKEWNEEQLNGTQEIIMTGVMVRKEARLDSQILKAGKTEEEMEDEAEAEKVIGQCLMPCPHLQTFRWIVKFKNILQS